MKKGKILALILIVLSILGTLAACQVNQSDKVISISLKSSPHKTEYTDTEFTAEKETIDKSGGIIEVVLGDGTTHEINMTDSRVSVAFDKSDADKPKIVVTFKEKTVAFDITVISTEIVATGMEITIIPTQDIYYTDSTKIDATNGMLQVIYSDESTMNVMMNSSAAVSFVYDFSAVGKTDVTVQYTAEYEVFEDTFEVTVKESPLPALSSQILSAGATATLNDETMFLYLYFDINARIKEIRADFNKEMIAAYENQFAAKVATLQTYYEYFFETYIANKHFQNEQIMEYLNLFLTTSYRFAESKTYINSEEFKTNVEEIMRLFNGLGHDEEYRRYYQTELLASANGNNHKYFYYLMQGYYSHILTIEELKAYTRLLETSVFYKYVIHKGIEIDSFTKCFNDFKAAYARLDDTTKFDNLFADEYNIYYDYFETYGDALIKLTDLHDFIRDDDGLEGALIALTYYSDCTYILIYYPELEERVNEILNSGDKDLIDAYNDFYFGGFKLPELYEMYKVYYDDILGYATAYDFGDLITLYISAAEKWHSAGGITSHKTDFTAEMREAYPDFDADMAEIMTLYWKLADEGKYNFIYLFDLTFKCMSYQHYRSFLTTDELGLLDILYNATLTYIQFLYSPDVDRAWFGPQFRKQMLSCINKYESIDDSSNFDGDENLVTAYEYYKAIYEEMLRNS